MFNFTIPSKNNKHKIINIENLVEGYYSSFNRITDYAVLKGAGGSHNSFWGIIDYPYWCQGITDDYTEHDDLYYGISPAQLTGGASYSFAYPEDKTVGIRLMLDYETILKCGKKVKKTQNDKKILIDIFELGKYPQSIVDDEEKNILEQLYRNKILKKTGRTYSYNTGSVDTIFSTAQDFEYEYNGQRYVRVKNNKSKELAKYSEKFNDEYYWVKVEPVEWYVNHNDKIAVSIRTLIGGVPYNIKPKEDLNNTYLETFIKNIFTKDINQDLEFSKSKRRIKMSKEAVDIIGKVESKDNGISDEIGECFDKELKRTKGIKRKVKK